MDFLKWLWAGTRPIRLCLWHWFRWLWEPIPLIGQLVNAPIASHVKTFKEFAVILPCSTLTFWFGPFLMLALTRNSTYGQLAISTMQRGELLIFAVGFMGPILNIAFEKRKDGSPFPGSKWHVIFLCLMALAAIGLYAIMKAGQSEKANLPINTEFVFAASVFISVFAIVLRYLTMVYRNLPFTEKDMTRQQDDLLTKFQNQH